MSYGDTEQRFVQLIDRAFRARIWLLVLLLAALFVVWATEKRGQQKAEEVERNFCGHLFQDPYFSNITYIKEMCSEESEAKLIIDQARHLHDHDFEHRDTSKPIRQTIDELNNFLQHDQEFITNDYNRRHAYEIGISFPYTNSPVALNGVLIFEGWPLCVLLGICAALALRFKQTCYEISLSLLISKEPTKRGQAHDIVLTGFTAGSISEARLGEQKIILCRRPIILSPETIVSGGLSLFVGLVSLSLLAGYSPEFLDPDDLLDLYYLSLYLLALVLALFLVRSRTVWRRSLDDMTGETVVTGTEFVLRKWLNVIRRASISKVPVEIVVMFVCTIPVAISLFFQWDDSFKGYQLLWRMYNVALEDYVAVTADRILLAMVLLLFIASLLSGLMQHAGFGRFRRIAIRTRRGIAYFLLTILGFPLSYGAVLGSGWLLYHNLLRALGGGVNMKALNSMERLPFAEMNPTGGYLMFLCSAGVLALATLMLTVSSKSARSTSNAS